MWAFHQNGLFDSTIDRNPDSEAEELTTDVSSAKPVRVQVFSKWPTPGRVKTRLTQAILPELAARLQWSWLIHTYSLASSFDAEAELWLDEIGDSSVLFQLGIRKTRLQKGKDLGERMRRATESAFSEGCNSLIIGTDCPYMNSAYLEKARVLLGSNHVVLGPATDGGYTLIGLSAARPEIFSGIPWGTEKVLAATLQKLSAGGVRFSLLETLSDVDRPEDLQAFLQSSAASEVLEPDIYRELKQALGN